MILGELASLLGCTVRGDAGVEVVRVAALDEAKEGSLTFLANPKYTDRLSATRATAVVLSPDVPCALPSLLSSNPYLIYARAAALLHPQHRPLAGVHGSAQVDPTAVLGDGVHVGPLTVVGARCTIGARTILHPGVVLYPDVQVGEDCVLHSAVQVREGCRLGSRVILQNGAVIGGDGFGFAHDDAGRWQKVPQLGIVVIEDDVEIGALSAVDRASLHETRIGRGTKIDNLVQIGHSVTVGEDTVMAGQVGIAGSTKIGNRVILAGQVGIVGHLTIGDGVIVTAQSGVPHSLEPGRRVSGSPILDTREWMKSIAAFAKLPELLRRIRALERHLGAEGKGEG